MEFISTALTHWHWLTLGVLLFAIELFAPTSFLLWPAIAAILTGLVTWLLPTMGWQLQFALFALLSISVTLAGRHFYKNKSGHGTSHPNLNRRGDSIKGRVITLQEPIINGVGNVMIDDTRWRLVGPDLPAGATLIVTGTDGASLVVEEQSSENPPPQ